MNPLKIQSFHQSKYPKNINQKKKILLKISLLSDDKQIHQKTRQNHNNNIKPRACLRIRTINKISCLIKLCWDHE
ncbi:unnamed protein product [Paramecium sonneborni]|uniref:Uncharacterized protein n=1 Tax=Paramecium sonneborni TaxID=65129 RepID=A0A8S1QVF9_9CILI|nr:unnamed protein product [Paramecium sonneborni]